ncbi:TetR/AcrR family transcriptional regulator [Nocardiopsis alba]|uniref:Bacterial regulatory s, tetR family protein n=1 Tax=Nocardiopsis alba (strain ATCC BAA-2165 / BE74) TaxID=1205910 RepID=J7LBX7_NOCAA|nr:TetR/AcrR family transcriptional regulator [Nocardiopsis alba]AFR08910.1 bacterial regulatory s, tetR family protein [Nocardiopsis alba ATCC BAA-2165]
MTKPPVTSDPKTTGAPSRRERVREATLGEIKGIARRHLVEHGVAGVSLRAVAREMGMTAPGLYRYVSGIDALLVAITADMFDELAEAVASADASAPPQDTELRLHRALRALRAWAIAHPAEFSVMFGPRSRLDPDADITPALEAGSRFGSTFFALFERLLQEKDIPFPEEEEIDPDLRVELNSFADTVGLAVHDVPVGAALVLTTCWVRVYGVVCMEVFQHLDFVMRDMEPLFESELQNMMTGLGVRYRPVEEGEGTSTRTAG